MGRSTRRCAPGRAREAGWRAAPSIQPSVTRVVDLSADEAALWSDLRGKWRQYVNKARSGGVTVVDADEDRLDEFHAILTETARRAGTRIRAASAYRDIWDAFRTHRPGPAAPRPGPDGERMPRSSSSGPAAGSWSRTAG